MTHRPIDSANPLLISTHDLLRTAGAYREVSMQVPAPEGIGLDVIRVPQGSPVDLDLELTAVSEGVLVGGTATVELEGECSRCLEPLTDELTVDLQELYVYPESEADEEDEVSRLVDETIDLEPLVRDQVVLELPFSPLCRPDCEGLCLECGANLNDDPDHAHEEPVDARWAALQGLVVESESDSVSDDEAQ